MKFAISNIAWPLEQDRAVTQVLLENAVTAIEVAPTKIWPQPNDATRQQIRDYRAQWESQGISIVAAQSLLFGHPELTLFDDAAIRTKTREFLRRLIEVCAALGCESLVFGSPKNRQIGSKPIAEVWPIAVDFFTQLGEIADSFGACIVLEANPTAYSADFITRANEALELVQAVNHPGFRLHLDVACMALSEDDVPAIVAASSAGWLRHVHISEKQLATVGNGTVNHALFAKCLREHHYDGYVSIEMRQAEPFSPQTIGDALRYTKQLFA
jgi:sugar phosphate isomerase/epimerase